MTATSGTEPERRSGRRRRAADRTYTLGLLVGSVANPFSGTILRAVEDAVVARGYAVFSASLDDDPAREESLVAGFVKRRVDGLILTAVAPSQSYLLTGARPAPPVVFVDRQPNGVLADVVASDNAAGAAQATRHLLAHGHRRIAFLGDRDDIETARERRRGFLEELERFGTPTEDMPVIMGLHDEPSAGRATLALLDSPNPPTAIFSSQNLVTIGAIAALRARGQGRAVALVGFDDIPLADLIMPGITVIAQDPYRIGQLAATLLLARLEGDSTPPRTHIVPTTLIARGSGEIRPQASR